jgi:hypothetical protein
MLTQTIVDSNANEGFLGVKTVDIVTPLYIYSHKTKNLPHHGWRGATSFVPFMRGKIVILPM